MQSSSSETAVAYMLRCVISALVMKPCGMELYFHSFLTLVLHGGEWLASRPGRFTPGKSPWNPLYWRLESPWSPLYWRLESPRDRLDALRETAAVNGAVCDVARRLTVGIPHVPLYTCACTCTDAHHERFNETQNLNRTACRSPATVAPNRT